MRRKTGMMAATGPSRMVVQMMSFRISISKLLTFSFNHDRATSNISYNIR